MGKHVDWITHKGKRILFVNVAGLNEADYIVGLEEMKQELLRDRTAPLVLIDLSKTAWTPATVDKAKEVAGAIKKSGVGYGPNAIVGLTKLQKSVADLSVRLVFYADSIEEAKDWLGRARRETPLGRFGSAVVFRQAGCRMLSESSGVRPCGSPHQRREEGHFGWPSMRSS